MRVISEHEKQQILAAGMAAPEVAGRRRPPAAPVLSMPDYLRQVEEFARLFPQSPRPFARGTNWKL